MKTKTKNITGWVITGLLALAFIMAGATKLMGQEMHLQNFERWGIPIAFMYIIGALEALGVVGLFIKKWRVLAGLGLAGLMLGGIGAHLVNNEAAMIGAPIVLMVLSVVVVWIRKNELLAKG